jgi:hypothetical protein
MKKKATARWNGIVLWTRGLAVLLMTGRNLVTQLQQLLGQASYK